MENTRRKRSRFRIVLDFLRRMFGKKPAPPGDPYAYAMAPLRRGPKAAAARL